MTKRCLLAFMRGKRPILYQHDFSPIIYEMIMSYLFWLFSPLSMTLVQKRPVILVSITVSV